MKKVAGAALCVLALTLAGCGNDGTSPGTGTTSSTTTTHPNQPAGPIDCPADLKRGHCTKCYYTGGASGETQCQGCSDPYKLNGQACTVSCSDMPAPAAKPGMPDSAMAYNGMTWPSLCFDEDEIHFFTVGDWGGVCSWTDGKCTDSSNPYAAKQPDLKGKPWPMPNRHGAPLQEPIDWMAQGLVADRMKEKVAELKKEGKAPKFILNVGDNFYPGGVDTHCDNGSPHDAVFTQSQFSQIFEQVYPVQDLGNIEWWSVLGNHDYGGVCYIKGWDQQIFYTFKPDGRWVMPAQYWHRKVQFQTFSVDFWFLDTNILDTQNPADNPDHNLCSARSNPGLHCENTRYPASNGSDPATCSATGPTSPDDCVKWFEKLWADQKTWFTAAVAKSDADWQIVVMHHPPSYTPGRGASVLHWADIARSAGIDLIVSGHKHEQKVYYQRATGGADLEDTAWVITGGGGGVTAEMLPTSSGYDDAYGFMDMSISLNELEIAAISHGGVNGKYIERSRTKVAPRLKPSVDAVDDMEITV
eukprot:CAMPEP_0181411268 /NCGR_PEP_ID=MMETSP1110-20121109/7781_1 /TAXON_ID=174948 /ORGANISM="Symbiodinium sp., Strain CCMP421" /LENGTH=527 /DNA_ID=CAMNT_0023533869 /DNA_START=76 /DNA_END=1659 /DNA_ORIENTATION=+